MSWNNVLAFQDIKTLFFVKTLFKCLLCAYCLCSLLFSLLFLKNNVSIYKYWPQTFDTWTPEQTQIVKVKEDDPLSPLWTKIDGILAKYNKDDKQSQSNTNNTGTSNQGNTNGTALVGKQASRPDNNTDSNYPKTRDDEKTSDDNDKKKRAEKWQEKLDELLKDINVRSEKPIPDKKDKIKKLKELAGEMFEFWQKVT